MIKRILRADHLIFMLAFVTAGVFLWQHYTFIMLDTRSISSDFHILKSLYYYEHFVLRNYNDLIHRLPYPPLVFFTTIISYILRGITSQSARLIMVFYAAIFLYSMYGIGRELGGGPFAGFMTLSAAVSSSAVLEVSRRFYLDFPQTALTALAFLMLIKTDGFKNKKYSAFFGIALSLSFLAKWSTAFFIILPLLCVSLSLLKDIKKNLRSFLLTLVYVSSMIAAAYYYFHTYSSYPYHITVPWLKYYLLTVVFSVFFIFNLAVIIYFYRKKITQRFV